MTATPKATLHRYLQTGREAMLWKLEGLSEYDRRRPMTATGTNLLGLVKHLAMVDADYFGLVFDRPMAEPVPWAVGDDYEDNDDMWATPEESTELITDTYRRVWVHSDATIDALDLDAPGRVPWWPGERGDVTLHQILVHMIVDTQRHAGHADIVRETIDGEVGMREGNTSLPPGDRRWWADYRAKLEAAAAQFR